MLAIKLSQSGKTNKKMFRLIISEKSRDPYGRALEILGSYNPHSKELVVKADRVKHWLSKGAQMTATVNNLLIGKNIIEGKKELAPKKTKTSEKRLGQLKSKSDKKAAKETAPKVEKVAEVAEEEIKEEAPTEVEATPEA